MQQVVTIFLMFWCWTLRCHFFFSILYRSSQQTPAWFLQTNTVRTPMLKMPLISWGQFGEGSRLLSTLLILMFVSSIIHSLGTSYCKKDVLKADVFHPPVLLKEGVNGIHGLSGQIHTCYTWTQMKGAMRNFLWDGVKLYCSEKVCVKWGQTYFPSSFHAGDVL